VVADEVVVHPHGRKGRHPVDQGHQEKQRHLQSSGREATTQHFADMVEKNFFVLFAFLKCRQNMGLRGSCNTMM